MTRKQDALSFHAKVHFVEVLRTLAWKMFGSLVRSRRDTASATHRTDHADAVEQEEQFNQRSFSSGISTSDCLGREWKERREVERQEAAAVEMQRFFFVSAFCVLGGKKKKKKGKKDRSYNNYLRILLIIYDDDDDDIIYYMFNAYIFVYGQTIKEKVVASTLAPGSRGEAQFSFSLLIFGIHRTRFRQTLFVQRGLGDTRDAMRRMSPAANTLPRSTEPFTVLTTIDGQW